MTSSNIQTPTMPSTARGSISFFGEREGLLTGQENTFRRSSAQLADETLQVMLSTLSAPIKPTAEQRMQLGKQTSIAIKQLQAARSTASVRPARWQFDHAILDLKALAIAAHELEFRNTPNGEDLNDKTIWAKLSHRLVRNAHPTSTLREHIELIRGLVPQKPLDLLVKELAENITKALVDVERTKKERTDFDSGPLKKDAKIKFDDQWNADFFRLKQTLDQMFSGEKPTIRTLSEAVKDFGKKNRTILVCAELVRNLLIARNAFLLHPALVDLLHGMQAAQGLLDANPSTLGEETTTLAPLPDLKGDVSFKKATAQLDAGSYWHIEL